MLKGDPANTAVDASHKIRLAADRRAQKAPVVRNAGNAVDLPESANWLLVEELSSSWGSIKECK